MDRWWEQAACKGLDPGLFIVEVGQQVAALRAKQVCARCPVKEECLAEALEHGWTGVWGGTTGYDRQPRRMRRKADV